MNARLTIAFATAVGILSSIAALAADPARFPGIAPVSHRVEADPNSEFMVSVWQSGEGLPVNIIHDIESTPDGFLWLGTLQGLVRFDGVRFKSFLTTPSGPRYGARAEPLAVDAKGRLWVAPDQIGLVCVENGKFTEILTNTTVLRARIESLRSDGTNGLVWIDAAGRMGRMDPERPEEAERLPGDARSEAQWIRDGQENLWLVNPRRIRLLRTNYFDDIQVPRGTLVAAPRADGGLWIAMQARLRSISPQGVWEDIVGFPWAGAGARVTCMLEDTQGRIWIGTSTQGLFCYKDGVVEQVARTTSSISCLLEDDQDNVWAGTRGAGLLRLRKRQFYTHDRSSGLRSPFVRSLCEDQEGRLWVVTDESGLGWWQNGAWHEVGSQEGWLGVDPLCVAPARDGGVWISTQRRELWRWSGTNAMRISLPGNGMREAAMDILEDSMKRVWMVTDNNGVYCLSGGSLTNYTERHGLPSGLTRRVIQDEAGEIWVGDWEGGVARFRGANWEIVRESSGHRDAVRSMLALDGDIWIGTSAGGLLRLREGQTRRISEEEGLPDFCVQQLLTDGQGSLWVGASHRLFRVSLEELNAVADGLKTQLEVSLYGRSDGLSEMAFAAWCDPRCWRTASGELWFATASGAIHFNPEKLGESRPPRPTIEEVLVNGKALSATELENLRPGPGRLEFRFTAPCLSAPERVRFRYHLSGVDPEWIEAGTARSVTYAGIPPGKHVFRLAACSPEGTWGKDRASIIMVAHPFFWQSPWFLAALTAFAAAGVIWAIIRRSNRRLQQLSQQHAIDKERARIAQDIHDELGANLTSIGLLADMGSRHKSNPVALSRELDQISETARQSVAAMDAIVWALNPRNDSLDNFANYLAQFTRDFFRPAGLRTRLELPPDLPSHPMGAETRHQLFLVVKESFNNIVRHAGATEARLELACEDSRLRLTISDNGRGFEDGRTNPGQDGLLNLRERIESLGGTLGVQSHPGEGTRLDFILPLGKVRSQTFYASPSRTG